MALRALRRCSCFCSLRTPGRGAQEPPPTKLVDHPGRPGDRPRGVHAPARDGPRGAPGSTITAAATYPATAPTTRLAATLERTPDVGAGQVPARRREPDGHHGHPGGRLGRAADRAHGGQGLRIGPGAPGGPDVVLLDDEVYSLYPRWPSSRRRRDGRSRRSFPGPASGRRSTPGGRPAARAARRGRSLSGDISGTLVTDAAGGRLERLELPGQDIVVHASRVVPLLASR